MVILIALLLLAGPACLLHLHRRRHFLEHPYLKGVPLPLPRDHRWKRYDGMDRYSPGVVDFCLGKFRLGGSSVYLDGTLVGTSAAYSEEVDRQIRFAEREALAALALEEIEKA